MTTTDLREAYAAKMKGWDDDRLRHELGYVANAGNAWGTQDVMDAWNECLAAEAASRGLTPAA